MQEESYVYTGIGYERIGWTVRVLDDQGRPKTEYRSDGTKTITEWGCCNREQTTDARGLTTSYG